MRYFFYSFVVIDGTRIAFGNNFFKVPPALPMPSSNQLKELAVKLSEFKDQEPSQVTVLYIYEFKNEADMLAYKGNPNGFVLF
jgi:hypothetical protein